MAALVVEPMDTAVVDTVRAILPPEDMWDMAAQAVYRAILRLRQAGQPWTAEAVLALLAAEGADLRAEADWLLSAALTAIPIAAAPWHARLAARAAYQRRLLSALSEAVQQVASWPLEQPEDMLAAAVERLLAQQLAPRLVDSLPHISLAAEALLARASERATYWPTGISLELDNILQGLPPGRLVLLAARTGRGKTSMLLQMAWSAAAAGARVYFASYEMEAADLMARLVAQRTEVPAGRIRWLSLTDEEREVVEQDLARMATWRFYLDTAPPPHVEDLVARLSSHDLDLVFVDYIQLLTSRVWSDARWRELGVITGELKRYTKEKGVTVVAAAQLSRQAQARQLSDDPEDRRPDLTDLRESGNLEQDADVVLFLWPPTRASEGDDVRRYCLSVAKNRHGPTRYGKGLDLQVEFHGPTQTFRPLSAG